MQAPKTIILRFRDLVTDTGNTVKEHTAIISKKNYVWWGWWNKQNEQVPLETFAKLQQIISNKSVLKIYLFDTGQLKLHEAECCEIKFPTDHTMIPPPEKTKTPRYYSTQNYKAWFKLKSISTSSLTEADLQQLAYVNIDSFFDDKAINYNLFENKVVSSFLELKLQDRSIWFVRDAVAADHNHEIRLTNANHVQPTHFTKSFKSTENFRLLWVSDLHFGSSHGFIQHSGKANGQDHPLWRAIYDSCVELKKKEIAGVIVSGDISTKGEVLGYNSAFDHFFSPICSSLTGTDFYNWIICPGNHDFGFSATPVNPGDKIDASTPEATKAYSEFYKKLFNLSPNEHFCSGRRFLLGNTYPIEVIALNSNYLQQTKDIFQGHGFVGNAQLQFVEQEYGWTGKPSKHKPFRIVVLHHHLLPITYTESTFANARYSVSLDAESITRWMLKNDVNLVLHGHMHQPAITKIKRPVQVEDDGIANPAVWPEFTICSLGSSGVQTTELGEIRENMFGIISFVDKEVQLEIYKAKKAVRSSESDLIFKVCLPL